MTPTPSFHSGTISVQQLWRKFLSYEGSSPAARVRNNSNNRQDGQFIVIVFSVFCTLHTSALCNRSPKHAFFFQAHPFDPCVCGGSPSNMDRSLSGWGYVMVLGPNSTICQRYSRLVADLAT